MSKWVRTTFAKLTGLGNERGQAMILFALVLVVIMGFAAFAEDMGNLYQVRRKLVTAADAASLAGASALDPNAPSASMAHSAALTKVSQNEPGASATVSTDTSKLTVSVTVHQPVSMTFARVLGINTVTVSAHATARKAPGGVPQGYILPIGIKDPRYGPSGELCNTTKTTYNTADDATYCHNLFQNFNFPSGSFTGTKNDFTSTFWQFFDAQDGAKNGYIELRFAPSGSPVSGNFAPITLSTNPSGSGPCQGMQSTKKYACQLAIGGYVDSQHVKKVVTLDTQTGNIPKATFEGISTGINSAGLPSRLQRAAQVASSKEPSCTPAFVNQTPSGYPLVYGTDPGSYCPLTGVAPLVKSFPNGTSAPVTVTAWVGIGVINACNMQNLDNPLPGGQCDQHGSTAIVYVKYIRDVQISHLKVNNDSASPIYTVKLID